MYPLRSLQTLGVAALAASASAASIPATLLSRAACTTQDKANPIAATYPNKTTGLFNGTFAVLPISLDTARAIVPAQYAILEHVYVDYFKSAGYSAFPEGYYPLLVQAGSVHDIQSPAGPSADFQQYGYVFPFVDRLGDNTTSFRYSPASLTSKDSSVAFSPDCAAYAAVPNTLGQVATALNVTAGDSVTAQLSVHQTEQTPVPMGIFRNITNQPLFADDKTCDLQVRLFNQAVFFPNAPYSMQAVAGSVVSADVAPLAGVQSFGVGNSGVHGFQLATPYIVESTGADCASLSGYNGASVPGY